MQGITIYAAQSPDIPRIVQLKLEMFSESGHAGLLADNAREIIETDYSTLYKEGTAQHFLAVRDEELLACSGAFIKQDLPFRYFKQPVYGFIGDVYTLPQYRSRGIASSLSQASLDWLHRQDIKMVRLLASEAGRPIYERLGFKQSDELVHIRR